MRCKAVVALAAMSLMGFSSSFAAQDGAALYKAKCSGCHGTNGEGKPGVKVPALKETTWDADRILHHLTVGEPDSRPPHNKNISGLSVGQAQTIAEFVKSLK